MRHRNISILVIMAGLLAIGSACSTPHQSDRVKVSLVRVPDKSFQAAHPIKMPADTIARVLRGVLVSEDQGSLGAIGTRRSKATRVFQDEAVAYLAPLIEVGLKHATPDQQIVFTINQTNVPAQRLGVCGSSPESSRLTGPPASTSGSIYAYGRSLYVTLSGLPNHTVLFSPEEVQRPESYRPSQTTASTLVIDYKLLARLPVLPVDVGLDETVRVAPARESVSPQPPTTTRNEPVKKDPEVEALRKELEDIKRRLAEQEAQRSVASPKKPPAP